MTEGMSIQLGHGERLLIVSSHHRSGAEPLMQEYFQAIGPIAGAYGFSPVGALEVVGADAGSFKPNDIVGFYSFPSQEAEERFENDPRWPAMRNRRPEIWSELRISHYGLGGSINWHFHKGKIYEVRYEWFSGEGDDTETIAATGGTVIASFMQGVHEMLPTSLQGPTRIRIVEWPDLATAKKARRGGPAYQRIDALYTRVSSDQSH
jgi:hypothetical protein